MQDPAPGATPPAPGTQPRGRSVGSYIKAAAREIVSTILPALVIVVVVNLFLGEARRVEMQSMEPNLHENQRLIIEKVSYHLHPPRRGDVVVFRLPGHDGEPPLIKRVIGLPGETVDIHDSHVYIDGRLLGEPYLQQLTYQGMAPRTVPENEIFVLGDNRGYSNDSRYFGFVPFSSIVGRAWFRYWPLSAVGPVR